MQVKVLVNVVAVDVTGAANALLNVVDNDVAGAANALVNVGAGCWRSARGRILHVRTPPRWNQGRISLSLLL